MIYYTEYGNQTSDRLFLLKHSLSHEWFYIKNNEMKRRLFLKKNRIFGSRNGKDVSVCEAFIHKDGTLHFTPLKKLN